MPHIPSAPTLAELRAGSAAFRAHERRDAMYVTASFLVDHFWKHPRELANGLGVLLLTWNQALYRYGGFDFQRLESCLDRNHASLTALRGRRIAGATERDHTTISELFLEFLDALKIAEGTKANARSPVAVAKALHLLAPAFFPLWDEKIATAYGCKYAGRAETAYLRFFVKTRDLVLTLPARYRGRGAEGATVLKLIDEYNYAKFTKHWV